VERSCRVDRVSDTFDPPFSNRPMQTAFTHHDACIRMTDPQPRRTAVVVLVLFLFVVVLWCGLCVVAIGVVHFTRTHTQIKGVSVVCVSCMDDCVFARL